VLLDTTIKTSNGQWQHALITPSADRAIHQHQALLDVTTAKADIDVKVCVQVARPIMNQGSPSDMQAVILESGVSALRLTAPQRRSDKRLLSRSVPSASSPHE